MDPELRLLFVPYLCQLDRQQASSSLTRLKSIAAYNAPNARSSSLQPKISDQMNWHFETGPSASSGTQALM